MRKLLPVVVMLLVALSACEKVDQTKSPVFPPEVAAKAPPAAQPSEGGVGPAVQPKAPTGPARVAPQQKVLEQPPAPSARDVLLLDMAVAGQNIGGAKSDLNLQKTEPAKAKIEAALRSLSFIETSLPSSRTLEISQRALAAISQGQNQVALLALQELNSVVPRIGGLSSPKEAAKNASDAMAAISKGNYETAKQNLASLEGSITVGQQESSLAYLKDHVRGAQYAIYRGAITVATVELDEANKYLEQLRGVTESAWPATQP